MVHNHGIIRKYGILIGILSGVMLLWLCGSGVAVAAPSTNITISLTTTPQPPTNFEITQTGTDSINITWDIGIGANITIVRGSTNGYPWSVLDGSAIYSGNGTYVEIDGLDLTTTTYYYRAWSQNQYGTSIGYAQHSIGVEAEEEGGVVDVSAVIDYIRNLLEGPMGIGNIILVVAFLGFAFWKKGWIRVILSLGIIAWGAFAFDYDMKVAGPLVGIGAFLFIMGILNLIAKYRETESESA